MASLEVRGVSYLVVVRYQQKKLVRSLGSVDVAG